MNRFVMTHRAHRAQRRHTTRRHTTQRVAAGLLAAVAIPAGVVAAGPDVGAWATAAKIDTVDGNHPDVNTAALDGCPSQSPDGLRLFLASNRPDGEGGLDIWVASRRHRDDPWGAPENLPPPINSASDDFCPTPGEGDSLLFVSRRSIPGVTCGMGDIYMTRLHPASGWADPVHLACAPDGPNSHLDEQGPALVHGRLYFSRSDGPLGDLFVATKHGTGFGPAEPIVELNQAATSEIQPNVRRDGRELVFASNRAGGAGGMDIWISTRASEADPWSPPRNAGPGVNTDAGESRPFLSADAEQLLFGRVGPAGEGGTGLADIYVTTRDRNP